MTYEEAFEILEHAITNERLSEYSQWLMRKGEYKLWKCLRDAVVQGLQEPADIDTLRFLFPKNRDIGLYRQWETWNGQQRDK